jgi:hypothetical protein
MTTKHYIVFVSNHVGILVAVAASSDLFAVVTDLRLHLDEKPILADDKGIIERRSPDGHIIKLLNVNPILMSQFAIRKTICKVCDDLYVISTVVGDVEGIIKRMGLNRDKIDVSLGRIVDNTQIDFSTFVATLRFKDIKSGLTYGFQQIGIAEGSSAAAAAASVSAAAASAAAVSAAATSVKKCYLFGQSVSIPFRPSPGEQTVFDYLNGSLSFVVETASYIMYRFYPAMRRPFIPVLMNKSHAILNSSTALRTVESDIMLSFLIDGFDHVIGAYLARAIALLVDMRLDLSTIQQPGFVTRGRPQQISDARIMLYGETSSRPTICYSKYSHEFLMYCAHNTSVTLDNQLLGLSKRAVKFKNQFVQPLDTCVYPLARVEDLITQHAFDRAANSYRCLLDKQILFVQNVLGDGNCFYIAFYAGIISYTILHGDNTYLKRFIDICKRYITDVSSFCTQHECNAYKKSLDEIYDYAIRDRPSQFGRLCAIDSLFSVISKTINENIVRLLRKIMCAVIVLSPETKKDGTLKAEYNRVDIDGYYATSEVVEMFPYVFDMSFIVYKFVTDFGGQLCSSINHVGPGDNTCIMHLLYIGSTGAGHYMNLISLRRESIARDAFTAEPEVVTPFSGGGGSAAAAAAAAAGGGAGQARQRTRI